MSAKALLKRLVQGLPFAADIYWSLRPKERKFQSRFNMDELAARLPQILAEVQSAAPATPTGKKIFFFAAWHYWIMHAALTSLTLRGLGFDATLAYLPYSDYTKDISQFDLRCQELYAKQVLKRAEPLIKTLSLLDVAPARHLPDTLRRALEKVSLIDSQYIRQKEDVEEADPIYRLRRKRNVEAARRSLTYFKGIRPDVIIVPNGMILEYGAVYETARFMGIPVVTYEFGEQDQRMWLSLNHEVMLYDGFNDLWDTIKNRKLETAQRAWLEQFLIGRQKAQKGAQFTHLWQKVDREGGERIKASLGLDERPVVLLPTNVLGDSATLGRTVFSRSMTDWIEQVVPFFARKPQVQLVVRIHPAETWTTGPSVADIIRRVLPELPPNIRLIGSKEKVNTYDLMDIADLGLVYTTTAGVEMAIRGIPVVVSGGASYRKRGFTIDADTWEQYFQQLDAALANLPDCRLKPAQVEQAMNYAYAYFHEFTRPFPWHLEKIMVDLEKRPVSYVLSPAGRKEFEATFQELGGSPIRW